MAIKIKQGITVRSFWEKPRSKFSSFKQVHNWLKETRKKNKAFSSKWVSFNRPGDRKKQLNCWCLPSSTIMASKIYFLDLFGYIRQTKHDTFYLTWISFPSSRYKWEETGQIKKYTKWPIYPPLGATTHASTTLCAIIAASWSSLLVQSRAIRWNLQRGKTTWSGRTPAMVANNGSFLLT